MNEKQETWRPAPAAKPSYLSSRPSSSTAALQGASTAFKPKDVNGGGLPAPSNNNAAAVAARDSTLRGRSKSVTSASTEPQEKRSPSRGRHLNADNAFLVGANLAALNARLPTDVGRSASRSTSAIAARLASSSSSPVRRTPTRSPQRQQSQQSRLGAVSHSFQNGTALPGAGATLSSSPSQTEEPIPVRNRMLNFEKIPTLQSPTSSASQGPGTSGLAAAVSAFNASSPPRSQAASPLADAGRSRKIDTESGLHDVNSSRESTTLNEQSSSPSIRPRSASQQNSPRPKPAPPAPRRAVPVQRNQVETSTSPPLPIRDLKSGMTLNHLADAMVASSLASTRTPSPTKEHPTFSRRRSASASEFNRLSPKPEAYKRGPPRPPRPMKQTLRKYSSDNEEDELTKRGRRHLVRKHPNMHHEGDRKRWRDKITERERKRYEGVFAANRGILLRSMDPQAAPSKQIDPTSENNQVINVVVRDVWERSRLQKESLREIYNLVAPDESQTLNREQFVVGLWLIDQKLKGRKLPTRVSPCIWASVRHSAGIKIRNKAL